MNTLNGFLSAVLSGICFAPIFNLSLQAHAQALEPELSSSLSNTSPDPNVFTQTTELLMSASQVGPITGNTPFDADAVRALFPEGYAVLEETFYPEGEPYQRISVRLGDDTLITFWGQADWTETIDGVMVKSPQIFNALGPRVGTAFQSIYPTLESMDDVDCYLGEELGTGYLSCAAPNADNVRYHFTGPFWGGRYEIPSIEALREWPMAYITVQLPRDIDY